MAKARRKGGYSGYGVQKEQVRSLDDLQAFDSFCNDILPKLRRMITADDKSALDIYSVADKEMAARMVTIALTEKDAKVAMAAIREVFDRTMGKAKETLNVNNRYEKLTDEELDNLLRSEEARLKNVDGEE